MFKRIVEKIRTNVPIPACILFFIALISAVLHLLFINFPSFAYFFNRYISSFFRMFLAKLTGWIPFSLAEAFLIFIPVIFVTVIVWAFRRVKLSNAAGNRSVFSLISVIALLYSMFVFNFAAGYGTESLENKLSIERKDVSAQELNEAAKYLISEMNSLADEIRFNYLSSSDMPYSNTEMVSKLNLAYKKAYNKYAFISPLDSTVKQVMLSEPMTYTHISGVYSFFTGEANINVNYPDFIIPYTAAHEMAHQRGIAREDEANFVAYLVCLESDDSYIRYSAYLNMYEYVISALAKANRTLYSETSQKLDNRVRYELSSYSKFFDKYRDSTVSEVSETINNTYLTIQGTEGTRSYGMVVDLFIAYINQK